MSGVRAGGDVKVRLLRVSTAAPGLPAADLIAAAGEPGVADALAAATEAAAARGVFGSPTMFIGDEMFFGNDRFDFVRDCIAGETAVSLLQSLSTNLGAAANSTRHNKVGLVREHDEFLFVFDDKNTDAFEGNTHRDCLQEA